MHCYFGLTLLVQLHVLLVYAVNVDLTFLRWERCWYLYGGGGGLSSYCVED